MSNAALKKRHSDTLTFTPSCLCLTLNCEKCCFANFQVNKRILKTPGTISVIPRTSMPKLLMTNASHSDLYVLQLNGWWEIFVQLKMDSDDPPEIIGLLAS